MKTPFFTTLAFALSTGCSLGEVDFARDIRPIFNAHCVACHGGVKEAGEVSFIYREKALGKGESGKPVIVPGDPLASEMMVRILSKDPSEVMPKPAHGPALPPAEVALLQQWIREGAKWKEHWSFVPPIKHAAPQVKRQDWVKRETDAFILARLEKEHLSPSSEASPSAWLRRVSLDLTGLPPSVEELDAFTQQPSEEACLAQVNRLLDSPHFGERWASVWMDLARYADSEGLGQDHRREVWKYRDWLINAFNQDIPYDQFTIEQLAGDLLPNATLDQRIATTFHRLTQANNEGGTDDEEFRVAAVMDRVATTWEVWQGLTMGCVQCHAHPYDSIEHKEYYSIMAFFNNSEDADIPEGLPLLTVPLDSSKHEEAGKLQDQIRRLEKQYYQQHQAISQNCQWQPTRGMKAEATKAHVEVKKDAKIEEFRTVGNVTAGAVFKLSIPIAEAKTITALRLEILPIDEAAARHTPEWGAMLRQIKLEVRKPNGMFVQVPLAEMVTDEPHPIFDPNGSLKSGRRGWGAYTKISQRRQGVVIFTEPQSVSPGDEWLLTLEHTDYSAGGSFPLIIKRGRVSFSDDHRWASFLTDEFVQKAVKQLQVARRQLKAIPSTTIPDIREMPEPLRRPTHLFVRGNWLDKGEKIDQPNTPNIFPPLTGKPDRLALAHWLASNKNPLTARVAVNRFWLELFGVGLVPTPEDFGSSGEKPTHPELLDTLAVRFQSEMKWSVKALIRELVLSAAYRQDSRVSAELAERDLDNRLLARGPRQRLTGEMVRDHGLKISGLLTDHLKGLPTFPPLPTGVWTPFDGDKWNTLTKGSAERYRRSVYTYWKRSIPYPVFSAFDAPARELCSKRRIVSNTPLQALTTLNDPAFQEFAEGLGKRMSQEFKGSDAERLAQGYRLTTSQRITPNRLEELSKLLAEMKQHYTSHPEGMKKMAKTADEAAYAVIASVLFNLDESLIR